MTHGRQQIPGIVQYTGLTPLQIKHGLAVLVQQHLTIWSNVAATCYEANWTAAYALVRSGKFARASGDRFDEKTEQLFTECLLNGDSLANDLEGLSLAPEDHAPATNGINGTSSTSTKPEASHKACIYSLLENGLAVVSNSSHFRSRTENLAKAERHIRVRKPEWKDKIKVADKPLFQEMVNRTLHDWKYGSRMTRNAIQHQSLSSIFELKREFQTIDEVHEENLARPNKKRKIASNRPNENSSFDPELMIRPNHDKYPVLARSQRLVQLAADRIGLATSRVYATVLHLIDKDIMQCDEFNKDAEQPENDDAEYQPKIEMRRILEAAQHLGELQSAIATPSDLAQERLSTNSRSPSTVKQLHPKKRRLSDAGGEQVSRIDSDSDPDIIQRVRLKPNGKTKDHSIPVINGKGKGKAQTSIVYDDSDTDMNSGEDHDIVVTHNEAVRQHLNILEDHNLLNHHSPMSTTGGKERWSVPFAALSHELRLTEINTSISTHFGPPGFRIVRILQQLGKLDEKTLIAKSLIETKVLRSTLAAMLSRGYIELQELPRDNNRAPSKTLYLWFFDVDRCSKKMLEDHYQAMSRCLQRLRAEREQIRELLEKSERSDVKGRESDVLPKNELERLQKWRATEEKLLGQVSRLDDAVVVLRDL